MTSDPKAPGAAAVYLYREETEVDPLHYRTVYARIKVLTEQGKEAATVRIRYPRTLVYNAQGNNYSRSASATENSFDAPSVAQTGEDQPYDTDTFTGRVEVGALQARTIHADGTVIPLPGTAAEILKKVKGKNQRNELTFTLPDVQVGSIIEYRYQLRYDRYQSAPDWQIQQPYFVHKAHYMFQPTDQFLPDRGPGEAGQTNNALKGPHDSFLTDIRSTNILPPGKSLTQDAMGHYVVDLTDIPAIPQEAFAPPVGEKIYQIDFYYTYTVVQKEFWQKELGFWIKDLNRYIAPTKLLEDTVAETVSPSDSPEDKAKKLYALVQKLDNTDLSSANPPVVTGDAIPEGHVETVLENKSGTSTQIAFLYLALARIAGLTARPERIASRNLHVFSPQILDTAQLDAVVIGLTLDGKEVLIDPSERMAAFETLHWSHAGAAGVAMGADGKVETVLTPLTSYTDNTIVRIGKLAVSPQGQVTGSVKVGFVGQDALYWRQLALRTDADAFKQQLNATIASQVPDGIQAHVERIAGLTDPNAQLVAVVEVTGTFAAPSGNRITLPRLFFESKEADPFPAEQTRVLPIDMHYAGREEEQITYTFPAGFALEGTPQETKFSWENNASYQLRSKVDAASITSARVLARNFTVLEPADYNQLRDFYQKAVAADQQQIVLNASQAAGH